MNRKRGIPIVVVVVVLVAAALYFTVFRPDGVGDDLAASGTVEATEAALGFQVSGRIEQIVPREGDRVRAGDTLGTLDRAELEARRAQAQAQIAAAAALLAELEHGARSEELAQARAGDSAALVRHADAQRDFERTQRLFQGGAVSQEAFDKARLALDVARSQREQASEQRKLVERGPRAERVAAQRAAVRQAEASLRQADAALANAVIRAPFDGVVSVRNRGPGESVGAGAPVLTLVNLADRWVRIYIREDRIGAVKLGAAATITADTWPGKAYTGSVSFISSEAEFTPRNVQTTEERVKLVYAVKVRIAGDTANELKPGMPADVRLAQTVQKAEGGR
ncbi:MAG TPA: HlyD family efflux transporter periplasmic adaptor subunit [Gemmatimonadaceae bacterium]|nr:HlyD family efflux transporter periplasmic adaptor subunit [Gemmatimonadaceae bacterium]